MQWPTSCFSTCKNHNFGETAANLLVAGRCASSKYLNPAVYIAVIVIFLIFNITLAVFAFLLAKIEI